MQACAESFAHKRNVVSWQPAAVCRRSISIGLNVSSDKVVLAVTLVCSESRVMHAACDSLPASAMTTAH